MKAIFSLAALVIVLGLTALLFRKQLTSASAPALPATSPAPTGAAPTPANQVQQMGQQVQDLMQQPRPGASEP